MAVLSVKWLLVFKGAIWSAFGLEVFPTCISDEFGSDAENELLETFMSIVTKTVSIIRVVKDGEG